MDSYRKVPGPGIAAADGSEMESHNMQIGDVVCQSKTKTVGHGHCVLRRHQSINIGRVEQGYKWIRSGDAYRNVFGIYNTNIGKGKLQEHGFAIIGHAIVIGCNITDGVGIVNKVRPIVGDYGHIGFVRQMVKSGYNQMHGVRGLECRETECYQAIAYKSGSNKLVINAQSCQGAFNSRIHHKGSCA